MAVVGGDDLFSAVSQFTEIYKDTLIREITEIMARFMWSDNWWKLDNGTQK